MEKKRSIGVTVIGINEIFYGLCMLLVAILYINRTIQMQSDSAGAGLSIFATTCLSPIAVLIIIAGILILKLKPTGRTLTLFLFPIFIFFSAALFSGLLETFLPSQISDRIFYIYCPLSFFFPIIYLNRPKVKRQFTGAESPQPSGGDKGAI